MARKIFGLILVITCAVLLAMLAFEDTLKVIKKVSTDLTRVDYVETPNGTYSSSIISIAAFSSSTRQSYALKNFCTCKKRFSRNAKVSAQKCQLVELEIPFYLKDNLDSPLKNISTMFFEAPRDFANRELVRLTCRVTYPIYLHYRALPIDFANISNISTEMNKNSFFLFYKEKFLDLPHQALSGGYFSLIKLNQAQLVDLDGRELPENRFIQTDSSKTTSGYASFPAYSLSNETANQL